MQKALLVWVKERDTVMGTVICEKAPITYDDLKEKASSTSEDAAEDTFKASHGWFQEENWHPLGEV